MAAGSRVVGLFPGALARDDGDRAPGLEQNVLAYRSGHRRHAGPGGEHDELRVRLAGRLDDHVPGKTLGDAQIGLGRLIAEFVVDGGVKRRLGIGPLLSFGVLRGGRIAADRGQRRLVRAHRDQWGLPPAGFLGREPQRRPGARRVVHSYDNGHVDPSLSGAGSDVRVVDVAPAPVLARLERPDDRMPDGIGVAAGMTKRGRVAATHVPAGQAQPKVYPRGTQAQAFLAAVGCPGRHGPDEAQMRIVRGRHSRSSAWLPPPRAWDPAEAVGCSQAGAAGPSRAVMPRMSCCSASCGSEVCRTAPPYGCSASRNLPGVALRTMTSMAEVPGCTRSCTRRLKSSLIPISPATPSAAPKMPAATPTSGASGKWNSSPSSTPQNSPLSVPHRDRVMGGRGHVQLALAVAPDDGDVVKVDEAAVVQFDELAPDVLGRGLVRVADDDEIAHRGTSGTSLLACASRVMPGCGRCPRA